MSLVWGAAQALGFFFPSSPDESMCSQVENLWTLPVMTLPKEPAGIQNACGKREGCEHYLMSALQGGGAAGL